MSDFDADTFEDDSLGGAVEDWDDEAGFSVDFSGKEAEAEAFETKVIPAGWYHAAITEVTLEESKSEKNYGKPMFAIQLTIQDGPHKGVRLFDRWMLWSGALYSVSQALKAVGRDVREGQVSIPPAGWWMGKKMLVQVKVGNKMLKNDETGKYDIVDRDEKGNPVKRNETGGYKKVPADWDGNKGHAQQATAAKSRVEESLAP